jgi:hypothetical protein
MHAGGELEAALQAALETRVTLNMVRARRGGRMGGVRAGQLMRPRPRRRRAAPAAVPPPPPPPPRTARPAPLLRRPAGCQPGRLPPRRSAVAPPPQPRPPPATPTPTQLTLILFGAAAAALVLWRLLGRARPVYLLDFAMALPPEEWKFPKQQFLKASACNPVRGGNWVFPPSPPARAAPRALQPLSAAGARRRARAVAQAGRLSAAAAVLQPALVAPHPTPPPINRKPPPH